MNPRIAALQGSSSTHQALLGAFAARACEAVYRVAGVGSGRRRRRARLPGASLA